MTGRWYVVMLPGEDAETSEGFGPFRSLAAAEKTRDEWNANPEHADDQAWVLTVSPRAMMANSYA